jgi:hypothetical protein
VHGQTVCIIAADFELIVRYLAVDVKARHCNGERLQEEHPVQSAARHSANRARGRTRHLEIASARENDP